MRRRGFSLIELLVVIFIIGLLVAMIIPGIAAAQRLAVRYECKTRLKQIGVGFHEYFHKKDRLPCRSMNPSDPTKATYPNMLDAGLNEVLRRHLSDPKVFFCPDNNYDLQPPASAWPAGGMADWTAQQRTISYAFFDGLPETDWAGGSNWEGLKVWKYKVGVGANNYKWGEPVGIDATTNPRSSNWHVNNGPLAGDLVLERPSDEETSQSWLVNHSIGATVHDLGLNVMLDLPPGQNILFHDGHVEWVAVASFVGPQTSRGNWVKNTLYNVGDYVTWRPDVSVPDTTFVCVKRHTSNNKSGTPETDADCWAGPPMLAWRRVWKHPSKNEYLWWIWKPSSMPAN